MLSSIFNFTSDGTIIEGIGNELLYVIGALCIGLFLLIAWMSTNVRWEGSRVRVAIVEANNLSEVSEQTVSEPADSNQTTSSENTAHTESDSSDNEVNDGESHETEIRRRKTESCAANGAVDNSAGDSPRPLLLLRLQYLNDRTRTVHSSPDTSIRRFKREHFRQELEQEQRSVRLIWRGRELLEYAPRSQTKQRLRDYNLVDGATIHCLVTQHPPSQPQREPATAHSEESLLGEFELGTRLMEPLFAFLLGLTWFFRVVYRQYFNSMSTFALVALSVFFCAAVFSSAFVSLVSRLNLLMNRRSRSQHAQGETGGDSRVVTITMVTVPSNISQSAAE